MIQSNSNYTRTVLKLRRLLPNHVNLGFPNERAVFPQAVGKLGTESSIEQCNQIWTGPHVKNLISFCEVKVFYFILNTCASYTVIAFSTKKPSHRAPPGNTRTGTGEPSPINISAAL